MKISRNKELARIHIAKAQLQMAEDSYRAIVRTISNQRADSAADLDYAERSRLLEHFRRLGWKDGGQARGTKRVAPDKAPLMHKIDAMLTASARPRAYADGMARRMFKVARVDWCSSAQLHKLVAALAYDARRRAEKAVPAAPAEV